MTSQDIIDFMLGKKDKKNSSKGSNHDQSLVALTPPPSALPLSSPNNKKTKAQLAAVTKAFEKTLVQDWLETDDVAHQVLHSIANLRERLWHTSLMLVRQTTTATATTKQAVTKQGIWMQGRGGYRRTSASTEFQGGGLVVQDLQMTLDHDLVQHERMLVSLRSLLATQGQAQEALSRRLDEGYRLLLLENDHYHPQYEQQSLNNDDDIDYFGFLFTATSKELYRKQKLAARVFDSCNDGLLFTIEEDDVAVANDDSSPRHVAQCCSEQWSRTHPESYLLDCGAILKDMMIKQQQQQQRQQNVAK